MSGPAAGAALLKQNAASIGSAADGSDSLTPSANSEFAMVDVLLTSRTYSASTPKFYAEGLKYML